jgi:Na+:H+ antiporter
MAEVAVEQLVRTEYLIPLMLGIIFVASVLSSKLKVPHTMILVAIGIAITVFHFFYDGPGNLSGLHFDPNLIIFFVIPPLIFEAMMKIKHADFKQVQISAFMLAIIGPVIATIVVGFSLVYLAGLPYYVSFVFAALIAPTDVAMVIEIFKRVNLPKPLVALMQSEASFNDAIGIILFSISVTIFLIPQAQGTDFPITSTPIDIFGNIENLALNFLVGSAIGLGFAAGAKELHRLIDDPFSETGLTIALVFGSVVVAESLGVSPLIAVAMAGLYFGNVTTKNETVLSEQSRIASFGFWEMIAFFANSIAFLYLGLSMDIFQMGQNILIIVLSFALVLFARAVSSYPILSVIDKVTKENIPQKWHQIVFLGGMRGALSIALVATLPDNEYKVILQSITFGVVLLSLIVQYPSLVFYIKKAKL